MKVTTKSDMPVKASLSSTQSTAVYKSYGAVIASMPKGVAYDVCVCDTNQTNLQPGDDVGLLNSSANVTK